MMTSASLGSVSAPFDLAVRGGTVVTGTGRRRLDVYTSGGRIAALLPQQRGEAATRTMDASGCLVLPGFVDTHVHLMDPGDPTREDFPSGSAGAALSGVTTIVEHTHGWPITDTERLREKLSHLRGRSWVDYGLAAHVWPDRIGELGALWRAGVTFFKVFTCATHGVPAITADLMLDLFEEVARTGARCLVHCEDDLITARNERRLRAAGRTDGALLAEWRSRDAELVAVGTTCLLARATGAQVSLAHVSNPAPLAVVARERAAGARVAAETCPQYLTLWEHEALTEEALRKFTPPARIRSARDEAAMWLAVEDGTVAFLSSDHAPSTLEQKAAGDLWEVHFGLPGLDTTSSILLDAGLSGRVSLERVVATYAEAAARWYGLAGKGALLPRADADIVVVAPDVRRTLRSADVRSRAGWTPYDGYDVRGAVVHTILRGLEVVADGRLVDRPPPGRFVPGPGASS